MSMIISHTLLEVQIDPIKSFFGIFGAKITKINIKFLLQNMLLHGGLIEENCQYFDIALAWVYD